MKSIIVNHIVLISLFFMLFFSNCGFQLNRNRAELKNGANSLHIQEVVNKSYSPALDVNIKRELEIILGTKKIEIMSKKQADLVIRLELLDLIVKKTKYALDPTNNVQSYQFNFKLIGKMKLIDNRDINQFSKTRSKSFIENKNIKADIDYISLNQDLTDIEKQSGNDDVVSSFVTNIVNELTDAF